MFAEPSTHRPQRRRTAGTHARGASRRGYPGRVGVQTRRRASPPPGTMRRPLTRSAPFHIERLDHIEKASACQRRPRGDARGAPGGERNTRRLTFLRGRAEIRGQTLGGKGPGAGYRVAELYIERRGGRSIVGNIYKGKVDNVLPGLEAAFVDIGLEKNGFLHVDEIVLPGVETAKRGRGSGGGRKIADLLKPGQEIVVQVVKDPLKTKGARLSMELTIAGRYMVYAPTGEGDRRLPPSRGQGARTPAPPDRRARARRRRRDRAHGRPRRQARGLRTRAQVPAQAARGARETRAGDHRAGPGLPGGRPLGAGRARHLLRALRAGDRRRRAAVPPAGVVLHAHRPGAGRARRAVAGARAAVRGIRASTRRSKGCSRGASICPAAAI